MTDEESEDDDNEEIVFVSMKEDSTDEKALVSQFDSSDEWIIDNGCSHHRPVIAKKVRKEVEQFVEQQGFTNEAIAEVGAKYEANQAGAFSAPTGTSTGMKTRSAEAKKEKLAKAKKEKPSNIQFKRKGKVIEPPAPKALVTTGKRKKEKEKKSTTDDEEESSER